jgi:hypothetical protein
MARSRGVGRHEGLRTVCCVKRPVASKLIEERAAQRPAVLRVAARRLVSRGYSTRGLTVNW